MGARLDLVGQRFGRLTVLEFSHSDGSTYWKCACDCGNKVVVRGSRLRAGDTKSCKCLQNDMLREMSFTHGMTTSHRPEYDAWTCMKKRCYSKNTKDYPQYGGRGITVCDEWLNDVAQFFADMGPKPSPKHTIDRIDTNGNYCKANCRWATMKEQCNNRRSSKWVSYLGETKTVSNWADQFGIHRSVILSRLKMNWSIERALTTPVQKKTFIK